MQLTLKSSQVTDLWTTNIDSAMSSAMTSLTSPRVVVVAAQQSAAERNVAAKARRLANEEESEANVYYVYMTPNM